MRLTRVTVATVVALGLVGLTTAPAAPQTQSMSAGELAARCSSVTAEDRQLCFGFILGAGQLYGELVRAEAIEPMACADPAPTIEAIAAVFVEWVESHPADASARAIDGMMQAAAASWPCD